MGSMGIVLSPPLLTPSMQRAGPVGLLVRDFRNQAGIGELDLRALPSLGFSETES